MHRRNAILQSLGIETRPVIKNKRVEPDAPINVDKEDEDDPRTIFNNIIDLSMEKLEKGNTKKKRKKEIVDQLKEYFEMNLPISRDNPNLFNFE